MARSKIRVGYILTPITFGGAEKVSLNFLSAVDGMSYDVQPILLIRPWEDETYFGREIRRMGYSYVTVPVALNPKGDLVRVWRVAHRLHSYLKKGSYDIVHTHGYFADICGQLAALMLGVRGISTCHGFIDNDIKLRIYNRLDRYALRLCKTVIAVSEMIKEELVSNGFNNSKITVIQNAVSPSCSADEFDSRRKEKRYLLHIAPDECVIGYLGRLSVEKGLACLLKAVSELLDSGMRIKLVIVGDGPERGVLEEQVKANQLVNNVIFTGFQTDPENWYPAFDIFALPSLTEGTPLALLESMASGVPVIASAVGGVPKVVVDGVNGLLVPPGVSSAIKEKVQMLRADVGLAFQLSKAGIETIKTEFSIGVWCRRIENCYSDVCRLYPPSARRRRKNSTLSG